MEARSANVVIKKNIHQQTSDFAFWQTQSYQARLAALEKIRQEYHRWRYGAEPRDERRIDCVLVGGLALLQYAEGRKSMND